MRTNPIRPNGSGTPSTGRFGKRGADIADKVGNLAGALYGGAGWLGERGSKASAEMRKGLTRGGQEMAALRHNPALQKVGRFARSPAGQWPRRGLTAAGFALGFAKHYSEGDKALPAATKAGVEGGSAMAGAWLGAKVGAGVGTAIGGPGAGTLIGGAVGAIAGGVAFSIGGSMAVEAAEGWIDDKAGQAQDWVGEQAGGIGDALGIG